MATLYEIVNDLRRVKDVFDETDDVDLLEACLDTTDGLEMDLADKVEGYVKITRMLEADAANYEAEEKAFQRKKQIALNKAKMLKDRLLWCLEDAEKQKVKTGLFTVSIVKNGGAIPVIMETESTDNLPADLCKVTVVPDTSAIRTALLDGKDLSGIAHLGERGVHLGIR